MFAGYFKHASQKMALSSTVTSKKDTIVFNSGYFVVERINPVVSKSSNTYISNAEVSFRFLKVNKYLSDNKMPLKLFFGQKSYFWIPLEGLAGKPMFILPPNEQVEIELSYPSLISGEVDIEVSFEVEGYYVTADNFRIDGSGLNKALVYALID
jgi:hypothetical protein